MIKFEEIGPAIADLIPEGTDISQYIEAIKALDVYEDGVNLEEINAKHAEELEALRQEQIAKFNATFLAGGLQKVAEENPEAIEPVADEDEEDYDDAIDELVKLL